MRDCCHCQQLQPLWNLLRNPLFNSNILLGWKRLTMTNTLAFHGTEIIMDLKSFLMQAKVGWGGMGVSIFMRMKNLIQNNGSVVVVFNQSDKRRLDVMLKKHLKLHKNMFCQCQNVQTNYNRRNVNFSTIYQTTN